MVVSSVGSSYGTSAVSSASRTSTEDVVQKTAEASSGARNPDVDTFVKSSSSQTAGSASSDTNRLSSAQIQELQEQRTQSFNKMISSIMNTQANTARIAGFSVDNLNKDLFANLTVTPEQRLAAQQAIGEDGEWGVNAVATRIVDLCVSLSGGDSSMLEEMRAAVEKGFQQATGQWGGALPSICGQTYDEINKRFDYWEEEGSMDGYEYKKSGAA